MEYLYHLFTTPYVQLSMLDYLVIGCIWTVGIVSAIAFLILGDVFVWGGSGILRRKR